MDLLLIILTFFAPFLPACPADEAPTSSSQVCYYDAAHRGNGIGRSFVNFMGEAYYLDGGPTD